MTHNITRSRSFRLSVTISIIIIVAYGFTCQLYAKWNMLLILPDFVIAIIFLVIIIESIFSWPQNKKTHRRPWLPLLINLLAILVMYCIPSINRCKRYPQGSYKLCDHAAGPCDSSLHVDYYTIVRSYMADDVEAVYLSDHKNFRVYLGTYDEGDEHIRITVKGDSISTVKTSRSTGVLKEVEQHVYSLKQLKRQWFFD